MVEPAAAPVLRHNPHLDELIVAPRPSGLARLREDLRLARRLRRSRFDIAIDLHGGPRSAWLAWASGAPMRIGYSIAGRSWMYTHVVHRPADLAPRHSVLNQADLLSPLGIAVDDPSRDAVEMAVDPDVDTRVERRLRQQGIGHGNSIVLIHVSAGNPFRRWPPEAFASVAASLVRNDPARRVIIVSGPSEHDAAESVARMAREHLRSSAVANTITAGDYDLEELRALAARAAVYIGGDTGPLHIVSTTPAPVVALLGPTLGERSRPWRDPRCFAEIVDAGELPCRPCNQRRCEPGDFRCLTGISPDRVLAAAERAMKRAEKIPGSIFRAAAVKN